MRALALRAGVAAALLLAATQGKSAGSFASRFRRPVNPAGYVFAIWGLIYLLLLAVCFAPTADLERLAGAALTGVWLLAAGTLDARLALRALNCPGKRESRGHSLGGGGDERVPKSSPFHVETWMFIFVHQLFTFPSSFFRFLLLLHC